MSRIVLSGPGYQQAPVTGNQDTWKELGAENQNRNMISILNTSGYNLYLYAGPTAPVAVDGSVCFYKLANGAQFTSGDHDTIIRGKIWGLVIGHALTCVVGEF
jgi:hypothetical protein